MTKLIVRLVLIAIVSSTALTTLAPSAYAGAGDYFRGASRLGVGGR